MNENGFAVKGTMHLLQSGKITNEQAEEIVNIWIERTAKKFYNEGVLDGLKRSKRAEIDPLSVAEIEAIQTHLNELKEG